MAVPCLQPVRLSQVKTHRCSLVPVHTKTAGPQVLWQQCREHAAGDVTGAAPKVPVRCGRPTDGF
eukprot:41653-Eustigmatos_ZCMA.PRE.1